MWAKTRTACKERIKKLKQQKERVTEERKTILDRIKLLEDKIRRAREGNINGSIHVEGIY